MTKPLYNKFAIEIGLFLFLFFLAFEGGMPKTTEHFFFSFLRFLILYINASVSRYFFFIPFFLKRKFLLYVIFATINLAIFTTIYYYYKLYFINRFEPEMLPLFDISTAIFLTVISTILVCAMEFVYKYMQMQAENSKYQLASNQVVIKQLQSQLNPHFLFNSLNNAYGLSLSDSQKSSEYIMSLSQLMRYQIEGSKTDSVLLENDIEFMHHYIHVESQRVSKRCNLQFDDAITQAQKENYLIAPLLFLPFVENAIKHSTASREIATIDIKFTMNGDNIHFSCENNIPTNKTVIQSTGTGLQNVKTRLDILYPKKHTLQIKETATDFIVVLKIVLNKK